MLSDYLINIAKHYFGKLFGVVDSFLPGDRLSSYLTFDPHFVTKDMEYFFGLVRASGNVDYIVERFFV